MGTAVEKAKNPAGEIRTKAQLQAELFAVQEAAREKEEALVFALSQTQRNLELKTKDLELRTTELVNLQMEYDALREGLILAKKKLFGKSSEKVSSDQIEMDGIQNTENPNVLNEAEATADSSYQEPVVEDIQKPKQRKKHRTQKESLKDIPETVVEYTIPSENQVCPDCGESLCTTHKKIRKELNYIPARIEVISHETTVYVCPNCEDDTSENQDIQAQSPNPVIEGSLLSASLASGIIHSKYVNDLPLYRQEQDFQRQGIYNISRQNMANWIIALADKYIRPLYDRMHELLLKRSICYADETTTTVLKEPGRKASTKSYFWLYRTGAFDGGPPIVLFDYQETRKKENPVRFLDGFCGYLHSDAYGAYGKLSNAIIPVFCWSHVRRYWHDAFLLVSPEKRKDSLAARGFAFVNAVLSIEKKLREDKADLDTINQVRDTKSRNILNSFHEWLLRIESTVLQKSKVGAAIRYTLNHWENLLHFLLDPRLECTNNLSERSIKSYVMLRKNALFSNTPKGATSSALMLSLTESAIENQLYPLAYLQYLFSVLPNIPDWQDAANIDSYLPWSDSIPHECTMKNISKVSEPL